MGGQTKHDLQITHAAQAVGHHIIKGLHRRVNRKMSAYEHVKWIYGTCLLPEEQLEAVCCIVNANKALIMRE